jgi:TolB-like protein/DNA-binding winged helix-turn-helix (wHTH) protein
MSGTSSSLPANGNLRFGVFEVDVQARELRKKGSRVKLQQQPFELLVILLEHPGQVLSREDLRQRLWPADVYVDFDRGLNKAMVKLREALGDSSDSPIYVETLPRVGYRFIGPVQAVTEPAPTLPSEVAKNGNEVTEEDLYAAPATAIPAAIPAPQRKIHWWLMLGSAAVLLALAGLGMPWARRHRAAIVAPIRSIAVLPLDNLSGDAGQDYLAAGMTDELTTMLAKNSNLRVVSRTSVMQYKGAHQPLAEIARELGVDGILEGSVERTGDTVHMTVQLIQAPGDSHVWAESYDRNANDLVTLPSDAAKTIAKKLNASVAQPAAARFVNPEAHDAVLRGMYFWYALKNDESGEYFKKATRLQPDYAMGWAALSMHYGAGAAGNSLDPRTSLGPEEEAAKKAVELDNSLAEAHHALGAAYYFNDWNWESAQREIDRAIELDPNFAEAYHFRAKILLTLNRFDDAIVAQKKADELDPRARPWALGGAYAMARRYDEALADVRQKLKANPNDAGTQGMLAFIFQCTRQDSEGIPAMEKMYQMWGDPQSAAAVRSASQQGGFNAVMTWRLHFLEKKALTSYVSPTELAYCHAELGQREQALALLEEGLRQRAPGLLDIQGYSAFDILHGEERYRAIVTKVGMPPAY